MPGRFRTGLAAVLLLSAVTAGCSPPPFHPQVALLNLSAAACDTRPDFASAMPVQVDNQRGTSAVLDGQNHCLLRPGGSPTTYAVFALPTDPAPYTLEILSTVVPSTIVWPTATLFDAAGQPVRTVPPEEFEPNIAGLRAGVRPRGTERWLVVSADQARLGQTLNLQLSASENRVQLAAAIIIVPVVPPTFPDLVRQRSATVALNGRITVLAAPARTVP